MLHKRSGLQPSRADRTSTGELSLGAPFLLLELGEVWSYLDGKNRMNQLIGKLFKQMQQWFILWEIVFGHLLSYQWTPYLPEILHGEMCWSEPLVHKQFRSCFIMEFTTTSEHIFSASKGHSSDNIRWSDSLGFLGLQSSQVWYQICAEEMKRCQLLLTWTSVWGAELRT